MFKSTSEFDDAILRILRSLRDDGYSGIDTLQHSSGFTDEDFTDAIQRAIDIGLIVGLDYHKVHGSIMYSESNPRLTYDGLKFIENLDSR